MSSEIKNLKMNTEDTEGTEVFICHSERLLSA